MAPCAHPVVEFHADGTGECFACGRRVGVVVADGQPRLTVGAPRSEG